MEFGLGLFFLLVGVGALFIGIGIGDYLQAKARAIKSSDANKTETE